MTSQPDTRLVMDSQPCGSPISSSTLSFSSLLSLLLRSSTRRTSSTMNLIVNTINDTDLRIMATILMLAILLVATSQLLTSSMQTNSLQTNSSSHTIDHLVEGDYNREIFLNSQSITDSSNSLGNKITGNSLSLSVSKMVHSLTSITIISMKRREKRIKRKLKTLLS